MNEIKPQIEIELEYSDYDINITDSKHSDNHITITREEASWLYYQLKKLL